MSVNTDINERPRTASPARSFRSRMGTMLRRNSAALAFNRPSSIKTNSRSSLKTPTPPTQETHAAPSPVQESPARELAAEGEEAANNAPAPVGPSPLTQEVAPSTVSSPAPTAAVLTSEPEAIKAPTLPKPQDTEQPISASTSATTPVSKDVAESIAEPKERIEETHVASESIMPTPAIPDQPPIIEERGADYFAFKDEPSVIPKASNQSLAASHRASESIVPSPAPATTEVPAQVEETHYNPVEDADASRFAWRDEPARAVSPKPSSSSLTRTSRPNAPALVSSPKSIPQELSRRGSKSSLASSFGEVVINAAGRRVAVSVDPSSFTESQEPRRGRSRASSIRVSFDKYEDPYSDPFADPPAAESSMPIPHHTLSPIQSAVEPSSSVTLPSPQPISREPTYHEFVSPPEPISLPQPELAKAPEQEVPVEEHVFPEYSPTPVVMPLPAASSVIAINPLRQMPSGYSIGENGAAGHTDHNPHETDERLPLLPRGLDSKSAAGAQASQQNAVAFPSGHAVTWPTPAHSIQSLGWTEYILPDSSFYYSHRNMHITTDIDLRNAKKLERVTEYLDRKLPEEVALPPEGWELWLRDAGKSKLDFAPVRSWVNHQARILSFDPPPAVVGEADTLPDHITDDDRLDMEYRYWAFLEGHPAHAPLPSNAHAEAMDALTWSYTDCLLPSQQPAPPPFMPQECQELMGLLRSFENQSKNNSVVHTRIVARVLLRIVQWRQQYFRPNKPLPRDTAKGALRQERRMPFRRAVLDIFMSILCLGIPYLFMNRSHQQRIDEESGLHSPGPMMMIGACSCLVSAVILSASVTFMSLPGLDDVARLAGLIAILFSASSMVSSVVALFRYKADVERTIVYVGGEGLMLLSQKRSIIMSLPLVFLAWAIAAFITGITFYSFRGVTLTSRIVIKQPFEDYTHWAMVGTLGGLAGVLIMSVLLARR